MKLVYTGIESSGKTLMLAKKVKDLIERNRNWLKKYGYIRKIYSNLIFSPEFLEKNSDFLVYWQDYKTLIELTGIDIIWDEISSDFSSLKREPLPKRINRWLRQGAKQGVHIYSTAQEFHDIHLDFRRRVFEAFQISKVCGSRRSGNNIPPINHIWGLCIIRQLKIRPYNELMPQYVDFLTPGFTLISKSDTEIFDTNQLIKETSELPLEHIERKCPVCFKTKVWHY